MAFRMRSLAFDGVAGLDAEEEVDEEEKDEGDGGTWVRWGRGGGTGMLGVQRSLFLSSLFPTGSIAFPLFPLSVSFSFSFSLSFFPSLFCRPSSFLSFSSICRCSSAFWSLMLSVDRPASTPGGATTKEEVT